MSPIAQSVETTLPSSLASTSAGAPAPVERYTVFLLVPLVVVAVLVACILVARMCMRRSRTDAAREADVECSPNEPLAKLVNLSARHDVVVVRADVRCSTYLTLDTTTACPTSMAVSKTPTIVEADPRRSLVVEFDIADVIESSKEGVVRDVPEHDDKSASVTTRLRQPASEAWWTAPMAVVVEVEEDIVDMASALPHGQ